MLPKKQSVLFAVIVMIIAVIVMAVVLVSILIYSEMIVDENRFLITPLGILNNTILDQPFSYPSDTPNIDVHFVEILPNAQSNWHTHETPIVATVLQGEVTVYYCTGEPANVSDGCIDSIAKHYKAGDTLVEAIGITHNGVNTGVIPTKILVVALN